MNSQLSVLLFKISTILSLIPTALAAQIPTASFQVLPVVPVNPDPWAGYAMLKKVAACESIGDVNAEPRQFYADGSILWGNDPKTGKPIKRDVGILQINLEAHGDELARLGLDVVNSEADNIAYGKLLYDREGLRPWFPSRKCWSGQATFSLN